MANYNAMSETVMERVLKLSKVFKAAEVAEMVGLSLPSVHKVLRADKLAAAGDVDALVNGPTKSIAGWAAKRHGIVLTPPEEEKKPEPVEETPPAEEKQPDNTALCMLKILNSLDAICSTLTEINKRLSAINGRVSNIESAQARSIDKDCLNANFNLLFSEMKEAGNAQ